MGIEPTVGHVDVNGLQFSYIEVGQGPAIFCFHGYPDTAHTWSHLMHDLAHAGYRVIAPFMRGYSPTAIPVDGSYSALDLGADVIGLIGELGDGHDNPATVIGHDWGALATYAAANLAPEKIAKMITVAIPHPRSLRPSLLGLWKSRHFLTYQFRRRAVRNLLANGCVHVDQIYRRWSPEWRFAPDETQAVKEALALPGVAHAMLGYYWSFRSDLTGPDRERVQKITTKKTSVPTLCIVGAADGALDLSVMPNTPRAFTGSYNYQIWDGVGHFLHRESPQKFSKAVLEYLKV